MDLEQEINKIVESFISDKEKVELLLKLDAKLMLEIDKNSTQKDKEKRKVKSRKIYRAMKPYDLDTYELLIKHA